MEQERGLAISPYKFIDFLIEMAKPNRILSYNLTNYIFIPHKGMLVALHTPHTRITTAFAAHPSHTTHLHVNTTVLSYSPQQGQSVLMCRSVMLLCTSAISAFNALICCVKFWLTTIKLVRLVNVSALLRFRSCCFLYSPVGVK